MDVLELKALVFILPVTSTKSSVERVVVLNSVASRVVEARRGTHPVYGSHTGAIRSPGSTTMHGSGHGESQGCRRKKAS